MTAKPSLLLTHKLTAAVEARAARDYDARLNPSDVAYGAGLAAAAAGTDALIVCATDDLGSAVIAALPASVRIIAALSVGHEHIDLAAARARGIVVTTTPDVLTDATAEAAMLMLLGAARRASEGERLIRSGEWGGWRPTTLLGTEVTGKHLGILGMGRIGRALARCARGFGMTIHYCNRTRLPAAEEQGAIFHSDAEDMLAQVDFLSLNCPATAETERFLDARRIALMRDGAVVVNTARGALVDDEALVAALAAGKIAAAGLDVFAGEPDIHPGYRALPNTFLMPHLGSATREARDAMGFKCLDNLDAFFAGKVPPDSLA